MDGLERTTWMFPANEKFQGAKVKTIRSPVRKKFQATGDY